MTARPHLSILTLLAAALFLRALVPSGWMPAPERGPFAIQPCPAAEFAPVPAAQHHRHGSSHGQHDGDCAFAPLHAGFASVDTQPTLAASTPETARPLLSSAIALFPTGPPAPPPPATGPPAIA